MLKPSGPERWGFWGRLPRKGSAVMSRPAVVFLLSGGMDSMVAADLVRAEQRLRLLPLFVDYGQPAASRELKAAKSFCSLRRLPLSTVRIRGYARLARPQAGSRGRLAAAFLPGRNLMLLTMAGLLARARRARFVGIGAIADQAFPDSTDSFFNAFNAIAPMALGHEVRVMSPLVHSSKAAVVEMGKRLGTPLHVSYSCYAGRSRPC